MKKIPEEGDVVTVNSYCYTNKYGGTEIVDEVVQCKIVKAWDDYECGWRYWAEPLDKNLLTRLKAGKEGMMSSVVIYISQFDIVGDVDNG